MKQPAVCNNSKNEMINSQKRFIITSTIMMHAGPYGGSIGRMPDADHHELKGGQSI